MCRNPFLVLGVSPTSSFETIQKAFRRLALQHHPDTRVSSSSSSAEQFHKIYQAYEQIRDGKYLLQSDQNASINNTNTRREAKNSFHKKRYEHYNNHSFDEEDFLQYVFEQTGQQISSTQRRELIELDRRRIPGCRYEGPGYDLARRVAIEQELFITQRNQFYAESSNSKKSKTNESSSSEYNTDNGTGRKNSKNNANSMDLRRKRRR
jgi:curved DNA-binding protein CbpA